MELIYIIDLIEKSFEYIETIRKKSIMVVLNLQEEQETEFKYIRANEIERFNAQEYKEICSALNEFIDNYIVYDNELRFIWDILGDNKENKKFNLEDVVVLNFARSGLKEGKKSLIPAFCDLLGITYTGSGAATQTFCRNKFVYNKLLAQLGVNVPKTYGLTKYHKWIGGESEQPEQDDFVLVKPIAESGSIGVRSGGIKYGDFDMRQLHFVNDQSMLFQEYIDGKEIECPFFEDAGQIICLPPIELESEDGYLHEDCSKNNLYKFSLYKGENIEQICSEVKRIANTLNIRTYGRIDFRIDNLGRFYLIDIATMPYLCEHSSFAYSMAQINYKRSDIFKIILYLTLKNAIKSQ